MLSAKSQIILKLEKLNFKNSLCQQCHGRMTDIVEKLDFLQESDYIPMVSRLYLGDIGVDTNG